MRLTNLLLAHAAHADVVATPGPRATNGVAFARGYLRGRADAVRETRRLTARVAELEGHVLELRSRAQYAGGGPRKEDAPDFPGCRI